MKEIRQTEWSNSVRTIFLVLVIILCIFVIYLSKSSLSLLLFAVLVAYFLSPLVKLLEGKLHMKRGLAVAISYILLTVLIYVTMAIIIPLIAQRAQEFASNDWPVIIRNIESWIDSLRQETDRYYIEIGNFQYDLSEPLNQLSDLIGSMDINEFSINSLLPNMGQALGNMLSFSTGVVSRVVTGMLMFITMVTISVHLLNISGAIKPWVIGLFEQQYQPEIGELINRLGLIWNSYFVGELKLMLLVGTVTGILYAILGIKWAALMGIIAGFCEIIPNIGPIISTVIAALIALIFGSSWVPFSNWIIMLIAIGISFLVQQVENILFVPRIIGDALNLEPVVIMIGMLVLSSRLGIFGTLLAAPVVGLSKEIMHYILCKIRREEPY